MKTKKSKTNPITVSDGVAALQAFAKTHSHLLSRILVFILALLCLAVIASLTHAATTSNTTLNQTILADGDSITVTAPNGGESWEVGASENITWTSTGTITNVKIELRRDPLAVWEELVATTPDDGSYPWTVTGPDTTEAVVRISKVTDASVNDLSDADFSIVSPVTPPDSAPTGGSGYISPVIDNLYYADSGAPIYNRTIYNYRDQILLVEGRRFASGAHITLNGKVIPTVFIGPTYLRITVPKDYPAGFYEVSVTNPNRSHGTWGQKLIISADLPPGEFAPDGFAAELVRQSDIVFEVSPGATKTVWAEFKNIGSVAWRVTDNQVLLGALHPKDRESLFAHSSWISSTRPTAVRPLFGNTDGFIQPGEIGRFEFILEAPGMIGFYREYFGLVLNDDRWIWTDDLRWEIFVKEDDLSLIDVDSKPTTPGIIPPAEAGTDGSGAGFGPGLWWAMIAFLIENWYWIAFAIIVYRIVLWEASQLPAPANGGWFLFGAKKRRKKKSEVSPA